MQKVIAVLLILACVVFTGCFSDVSTDAKVIEATSENVEDGTDVLTEDVNHYFVEIATYHGYKIVYDISTKVMYCMSTGPYNFGSVSPLYNSDGTLKVYEGATK